MEPDDVPFQVLREITDDFSDERKIGEGSFGVVYRGETHTGEDVAVKMLKPNYHNTDASSRQFKNEIYNLAMLRHQNIVQILGYCFEIEKEPMKINGEIVLVERPHRAIFLQYLQKGSLKEHLSGEFDGLDWDTRFKIIKGICEGLKYIHDELEKPLYHLDLKPENILLDEDMVPKIADFGLSRIFGKGLTRITEDDLGTRGYQPPEYIERCEVSEKFDVFSLGVIMIEIVSGREGYNKYPYMGFEDFVKQVLGKWRHRLHGDSSVEKYCHQVEKCTRIALDCVQMDSTRRPDIVEVTQKLNGHETDIGKVPQKGYNKVVSKITRQEPNEIKGQHQNIKSKTSPSCSELGSVDGQETSTDVVDELIVGRTQEKTEIMASLSKVMSEKIVILPIHGIAGIGKTTFARLIYNDPEFKCYSQVWVYVSQRFDLNRICESIISQLSEKESQAKERQMTNRSLANLLSGKKILIVLDDLWEDNQMQLQDLKNLLYHDDSNIIILVTTRSECVAERIYTNHEPYKILPLSNDMCWYIIKQRSDFEARDDREQLTSIGLEIAHRCGGVALAAQSLGFTLQSMNFDQWLQVRDSDIWNGTISNNVLASLMLSYSYMAPCLKLCFAYCAIFPKGDKIDKDDMIYQWISLDFIKPTKLLSNMQLCETYIAQLLGLSFFQHFVSPKVCNLCIPPILY